MGMAKVGRRLRARARKAMCVLASLALACALVPAASVPAFAASTTYTQLTTESSVDITVDGESAYLTFTTSEGGYYKFTWETDGGLVELLVYETDGTLIADSVFWDENGTLYAGLEADTTYYIEFSPYKDSEEMEVTVSVSCYVSYDEMSGTCGDDVTWALEGDYGSFVLTIAGTGAMYDYGDDTPWGSFDESIVEIVVGSGVTYIGDSAFAFLHSVKTASIASTVTEIGMLAFSCCNAVKSIELPSGLTSIGYKAFYSCGSLASIDVPASCSIGGGAFSECWGLADDDGFVIVNDILFDYKNASSYADVVVPDGIVEISNWAFEGVNAESITLPESVTAIDSGAFWDCESLTSVNIPDACESIGASAFYGCESLTSVNIPDACESIGASAFYGCESLTSIDVPASCSIGTRAFERCWGLLEDDFVIVNGILFDYSYEAHGECVTIPDGVTEIDAEAFYREDITSVVICDSVESIGEYAFYNCEDLVTIVFEGDAPAFAEWVFSYVEADAYYPEGNDTWTDDVMLDYGGDITWVAYTDDSSPEIVDTTVEFADVAYGAWYYEAVYYLADLGLITGYTSGSQAGLYGVANNLSRAQLVTILWRNACPEEYAEYVAADAVNETSFDDVADGQYYTEAVNWAVEEGYVTGYSATTFAPSKSITFQETCIVIARVATGSTDPEPDESASSILSEFKDYKDVSSWAQDGVAWCVENGIVSGYASGTNAGKLLPKEKMKRVRIAQVVYNALIEDWI